ncbi:MAG: ring-cleaving dioxygenase [Planctomycetota bacterium]
MSDRIRGLHHVTAISADPGENLRFYRDFLAQRLVKVTVNFDDPFTYHFYFGDAVGTPGTIYTTFPAPGGAPGTHGVAKIAGTAFAIPTGSLAFWRTRAESFGYAQTTRAARFGEDAITVIDPDGAVIELVESDAPPPDPGQRWLPSGVETSNAITRILGVSVRMRDASASAAYAEGTLGLDRVGADGPVERLLASDGISTLDVIEDPEAPIGRFGAGIVHHVAWQTRNDAELLAWRASVEAAGRQPTPLIDRQYFHSVYHREPGGVVYELATIDIGFTTDEEAESLGTALRLPPQHEPLRAQIAASLTPIESQGVWVPRSP